MRVNSISYLNTYNNKSNTNFKHTAVPYPEFESGYYPKNTGIHGKITNIVDKLSDLFRPDVTAESKKIKSQIDNICNEKDAKQKLIYVLA